MTFQHLRRRHTHSTISEWYYISARLSCQIKCVLQRSVIKSYNTNQKQSGSIQHQLPFFFISHLFSRIMNRSFQSAENESIIRSENWRIASAWKQTVYYYAKRIHRDNWYDFLERFVAVTHAGEKNGHTSYSMKYFLSRASLMVSSS